ncbi:MAG: MOSC domain-containing protein [Chloroflexota bacterium]
MRVISVNVGLSREIFHEGRMIRTGIFKAPIPSRVRASALNLAGDLQIDLTAHGGPTKAIYAYPVEHDDFWRGALLGFDLPMRSFGENLTTAGMRCAVETPASPRRLTRLLLRPVGIGGGMKIKDVLQ